MGFSFIGGVVGLGSNGFKWMRLMKNLTVKTEK